MCHQLLPSHRLLFPVDFQSEFQPIGKHGIDGDQRTHAVGVFRIDNLLGILSQRKRLEPTVALERIRVIWIEIWVRQQGFSLLVAEGFPPQIKKENPILQLSQLLLHVTFVS